MREIDPEDMKSLRSRFVEAFPDQQMRFEIKPIKAVPKSPVVIHIEGRNVYYKGTSGALYCSRYNYAHQIDLCDTAFSSYHNEDPRPDARALLALGVLSKKAYDWLCRRSWDNAERDRRQREWDNLLSKAASNFGVKFTKAQIKQAERWIATGKHK